MREVSYAWLTESGLPDFRLRIPDSIIRSGDSGVLSGFAPQVRQISTEFGVSQEDLW